MVAKSGPICQSRATHCMRMPLRSTEQIYLVFLIPTLTSCAIYVVHLAADSVVAVQHFRESNPVWGSCTLALAYAPAVAYFVLTVSRPDWWMSEDDKISKGIVTWFILHISQLFLFPLFALYRFAGQIVLAVDAINLSGRERTKTLDIAAKPAAIELYFFLQAWFQAAPQAVFQTHLLFRDRASSRAHQSIMVQVLCIFMSIVTLSVQTMSFQRFESQRINGRKLPWAMWLKKYRDRELEDMTENDRMESATLLKVGAGGEEAKSTTEKSNDEEGEADAERPENETADLSRQISVTPPLPPKNARATPPPTPLRGVTIVTPLRIPDMRAPPRPDSTGNIAQVGIDTEQRTSDAASEYGTGTATYESTSLRLPKRKYSQKGLEQDDPIGRAIAFLWWFLFVTPRVFSIAVSYEFYPGAMFAVLGIHYLLMLCYLFYYAKDRTATTFFINIWLGSVYIVGAIEYKIKYKYADKWLFAYYTFVMLQNAGLTLVWYFCAEWEGFWYNFIFYVIFGSMGLCVASTTSYHVLFKPSKRRVYVT